jgi:hypothetical protein
LVSYRLAQSEWYDRTVRKDNIGPLVASNTGARTRVCRAAAPWEELCSNGDLADFTGDWFLSVF